MWGFLGVIVAFAASVAFVMAHGQGRPNYTTATASGDAATITLILVAVVAFAVLTVRRKKAIIGVLPVLALAITVGVGVYAVDANQHTKSEGYRQVGVIVPLVWAMVLAWWASLKYVPSVASGGSSMNLLTQTLTGLVDSVGSGPVGNTGSMIKRSYIKVGTTSIKNVAINNYLDDLVTKAMHRAEPITLVTGRCFWSRWVLALRNGEGAHRESLFRFVILMVGHVFVFGIIAVVAGATVAKMMGLKSDGQVAMMGLLMIPVALTVLINLKTWAAAE